MLGSNTSFPEFVLMLTWAICAVYALKQSLEKINSIISTYWKKLKLQPAEQLVWFDVSTRFKSGKSLHKPLFRSVTWTCPYFKNLVSKYSYLFFTRSKGFWCRLWIKIASVSNKIFSPWFRTKQLYWLFNSSYFKPSDNMLKKRNVEKSQKRSVESKYRHKMETIGERHKYAPDFTKLDKYQTF